jgi:hypothetical protein
LDIFNKILTKFEMKINTMKLKLTALLLVLYTGLYAQNKIVLTAPRLDTSSLSNRINLKANTNLNNVNGVLSSTYGGAGSVNGILKANGSGVVSPVIASDITTLISGTYLPLSGGTLTGALNGTSAAFSGAGSFLGNLLLGTTTESPNNEALQVAGSGLFSGSVTANGVVTVNAPSSSLGLSLKGRSSDNIFTQQYRSNDDVTQYGYIQSTSTNGGTLQIGGNGAYKTITIDNTGFSFSGGAITASSSVTANSFVKSGGTSSQFLKADGSVDANTYATTSSLSSYATTASLSGYVDQSTNQYEIGGNKSFLGNVEVLSIKTTGGPGTPGVLKFGTKTNDTVFTGGYSYSIPVNIDGTTYYIRLWAGIN